MSNPALIDVHHHALPAVYTAALAQQGVTEAIPGQDFPAWSPELSLQFMDAHNIQKAYLSVTAPGFSSLTGQDAIRLAYDVNSWLATLTAESIGKFGAFAMVPLDSADTARVTAEAAIEGMQLDGVGLYTSTAGRYLGSSDLDPLWEYLEAQQVPVFIHPVVGSVQVPSFGLPASILEFPIETARAIASFLFSGTLDRFSGLKLIFTHSGGALPALLHRLSLRSSVDPLLAAKPPVDLLASFGRLYFDVAMSATPGNLEAVRALISTDRLLFGSDFPLQSESYAGANADVVSSMDIAGNTTANARDLFARHPVSPA
jgi:predicted TIM-barrel fold metal-dependent hydrolase